MRAVIRNEHARKRAIAEIEKAQLPVSVSIKPYRRNRSLEQNDMFHGILQVISDYTGYTTDEVKELVMSELGYIEPREVMGHTVMMRRSTSKMKTDELSELIEKTLAWAALNGLPTLRQ